MIVELESMHEIVATIDASDIREIYCANPEQSEDIIRIVLKSGKYLYCDCLTFND